MSNDSKRALIVVDVQNDFCPGGSLAVTHGDEVVAPLNKLIDEFLKRGEPVFKTRDWHPATTKHFQAYGGAWPVHCVQNTEGAAFHPDLLDDKHIRIISKGLGDEDCYSGFDGTDLTLQLERLGVKEIWVGGLATDYCVKQTVLDGLKEGFRVKAIADAMRPVEINFGDGERAVNEMKAAGAEIIESTAGSEDPVIEAYKSGIDESLIAHNLGLSVDERFEQLMNLQRLADELRAAGERAANND
jgi:nicotinamidase/pyrazinamidase